MVRKLTRADKELAAYLLTAGAVGHAIADFAAGGALTKIERNTLLKILRKAMPPIGRFVGRQATQAASSVGMIARRHPVLTAGAIAYIAHKQGVTLETARAIAEQEAAAWQSQPQFFLEEQLKERIRGLDLPPVLPIMREAAMQTYGEDFSGLALRPSKARTRRRVSKANKAVQKAMSWLKGGGKAVTGTATGTLPKKAFRIAVIAAGLANPGTKSKPGKGKSIINKIARRLKKWW